MVHTKKGRGTRARRRTFFKSTWTRWVEAVTAGRAIRGFYYARDPRAPSNRGLWINIAISVGREIERVEPSIDGAATERIDKNSSRTASRHKYSNKGRPCVVGPPWERFVSVPIFNARPRAGRLTSRGTREKFSRMFFLSFSFCSSFFLVFLVCPRSTSRNDLAGVSRRDDATCCSEFSRGENLSISNVI